MVKQFLIKLTTKHFTRNLNLFNTTPAQPCLPRSYQKIVKGKDYHELGLESLQRRRQYKKTCLFYKIFKENKPGYLFNLVPTKNANYNTKNTDKLLYSTLRITFSKMFSFFHPLLFNGTSQMLIFQVLLILVFSKRICESLLDHLQIVYLTVTTAREFNTQLKNLILAQKSIL